MKVLRSILTGLVSSAISLTANAQIIELIAGDGAASSGGDGGSALSAHVSSPGLGCFDAVGNYYFGENVATPRIRVISPLGIVHTVAGNGSPGYSGDAGPATSAKISHIGIDCDAAGDLYIADYYNHRVRRVDHATGIINTVVGTGMGSSSGDGGPAISATLAPSDIAFDHSGNMFICDSAKVRMVNTSGIISTVAGNGIIGSSGDGGPATDAQITVAYGICFDAVGNIYIACNSGTRIRKIDISTGIISLVGGTGVAAYSGDAIPATSAQFKAGDIACDAIGNLYIADLFNHRVRKIDAATGMISTLAGAGTPAYDGDGGLAADAHLNGPWGLTIDECGNLLVADHFNNRIRRINLSPAPLPSIAVTLTPNDTVCAGTPVTYTATPTGVSSPTYQWYVNGSLVGGGSSSFTYIPVTGDSVYCKLFATSTCSSGTVNRYSNGIKMLVHPTTTPSLTITASPNDTVCMGSVVTISTVAAGGGSSPSFHWYKNGSPVVGGSTYSFTPAAGDSVNCLFVSSAVCPVPNDTVERHVRFTVLPYVTPAVSILSSIPAEGSICDGDTVHFSSAITGAGAAPLLQWKVNGATVASGPSFAYAPHNGDTINCMLTSSEMCVTSPTAISNTIGPISVIPVITPVASITASAATAHVGEVVTVNALVSGAAAYTIKWFINSLYHATTTLPQTTFTKGPGDDLVVARVIPSGVLCYDSVEAPSLTIAVPNYVENISQAIQLSIYPNPANGKLQISSNQLIGEVTITDIIGRVLQTEKIDTVSGELDITNLVPGTYFVAVKSYNKKIVVELIKR